MKLLKVVLCFELLVGGAWVLSVWSHSDPGLGAIASFLALVPVGLACVGVGVWSAWRNPETRPLAYWVMGVPIVLGVLPVVMSGAGSRTALQGIDRRSLWLLIAGVPGALVVVRPRAVGSYIPRGLLKSRAASVVPGVVLLSIWAAMAALAYAASQGTDLPSQYLTVARGLVPVVIAGVPVALGIALYSFLALFQPEGRASWPVWSLYLVLAVPVPVVVFLGAIAAATMMYG